MRRTALLLALSCAFAAGARAQSSGAGGDSPPQKPEALERRVSVHLRDVSLRDALDRVAALAGIRISYSGDILSLEQRVSLAHDSTTVASILAEVLRAYPVQPVAVAGDHVVLTPKENQATDALPRDVPLLDRVVITGSVIGASERPLPVALDVVPGRELEHRDEGALSKVFGGSVPGVYVWDQSPTAMFTRYGSIRGASSFGLTAPKIYVDGIEVANPLLLNHVTPELVERVEVIRGPQGAALYGSDAISGVVNIISRHEGTRADGNHMLLRSSAGYAASAFADAVGVQEHSLIIRGGSNLRSGGITVGGATTGEYIPRAYSREFRTVADARLIGSRSTVTASARFYSKNAGVPGSPLLPVKPERLLADSNPQELRMYSAGSTLTFVGNELWTYSVTAGLDGYQLTNASSEAFPIPSVADTALRDANGSAMRGTIRASAVTTLGRPEHTGATLTFAAEQSTLRDRTVGMLTSAGTARQVVGWTGNTGIIAQGTLNIREALYFTGGLRLERIGQTQGLPQSATLPMFGFSYVRDYSNATLKLRGAYGKGVRTPRAALHGRESQRLWNNPFLEPEEQSGTEGGVDLVFGRRVGIHVTRFDQLASGLIQTVMIPNPTGSSGPGKQPAWYQLQNVGEITNRGWETQGSLALGPASLSGAATFVDSRVRNVHRRYFGDLREGDRTLGVPARTLSGTFSLVRRGMQLSSTISRASDWVNYDRLRLAQHYIANGGAAVTGSALRPFWATYSGVTRLRAVAAFDMGRGMTLNLSGENLLNYQRGEPDTITIVPGRTITVGVKARF